MEFSASITVIAFNSFALTLMVLKFSRKFEFSLELRKLSVSQEENFMDAFSYLTSFT